MSSETVTMEVSQTSKTVENGNAKKKVLFRSFTEVAKGFNAEAVDSEAKSNDVDEGEDERVRAYSVGSGDFLSRNGSDPLLQARQAIGEVTDMLQKMGISLNYNEMEFRKTKVGTQEPKLHIEPEPEEVNATIIKDRNPFPLQQHVSSDESSNSLLPRRDSFSRLLEKKSVSFDDRHKSWVSRFEVHRHTKVFTRVSSSIKRKLKITSGHGSEIYVERPTHLKSAMKRATFEPESISLEGTENYRSHATNNNHAVRFGHAIVIDGLGHETYFDISSGMNRERVFAGYEASSTTHNSAHRSIFSHFFRASEKFSGKPFRRSSHERGLFVEAR